MHGAYAGATYYFCTLSVRVSGVVLIGDLASRLPREAGGLAWELEEGRLAVLRHVIWGAFRVELARYVNSVGLHCTKLAD